MIDLTPLDVRNKRGDFKKLLRGYDPQEVDTFLEIAAERMEMLVREVLQLRERAETLQQQVSAQTGREKAVQDALVTAQELRTEMRGQAEREAELLLHEAQAESRRVRAEAEAEVRRMTRDAERRIDLGRDTLEELERHRIRFLKAFRQLLEREMDVVEVEEGRAPLEDRPIELELGGGRRRSRPPTPAFDEGLGTTAPAAAQEAAAGGVDEPKTMRDERPPLDAPVDELASRYQAAKPAPEPPEGPAQAAPAGPLGDGGERAISPERDLFSLPGAGEGNDEDTRWG